MEMNGKQKRQLQRIEQRKRQYDNSLFVCLTGLVFFLCLLLLAVLKPEAGAEPRKGGSLLDGSLTAGLEASLADRVPGQEGWISTKRAMDALLGAKEEDGIYLADDGSLIEKPAAQDREAVSRSLRAIEDFAAVHRDLPVFLAVVPEAAVVCADKLPAGAPGTDEAARSALYDSLESARLVDLTQALRSGADQTLYYKTDPAWTALGARCALAPLAESMGLSPAAGDRVYPVLEGFSGSLARRTGRTEQTDRISVCVPEPAPACKVRYLDSGEVSPSLFQAEALETEQPLDVFLRGAQARVDITTSADTERILLLLRDEAVNPLLPLLTPCFDRIVLIDPRSWEGSLEALLREVPFTDVLILCREETILSDGSLAAALTLELPDPEDITETETLWPVLPGVEPGQ